ncbi:MAG: hypothetical protein ACRDF0_03080 [Candidatus Limnocylindria bacterium]
MSWIRTLNEDSAALRSAHAARQRIDVLERAGPRLIDSPCRDEVFAALGRCDVATIDAQAGLSYLSGTASALRRDRPSAIRAFLRALALADPWDRSLIERIVFELGYIYLHGDELAAADALLLRARGGAEPSEAHPDLDHLQALIADHQGDHYEAREGYRAAIGGASFALTPATRVLALTNLAVALNHTDPQESLSLCGLALATLDAELLHPRTRPAVRNVMTYALLCLGELRLAEDAGLSALADARLMRHEVIELYVCFNLSIAAELQGRIPEALARLDEVSGRVGSAELHDLGGWVAIRRAWLLARAGDPDQARRTLAERFAQRIPAIYSDALDTIDALLRFRCGELSTARKVLIDVTGRHLAKANELDRFAALLWLARLDEDRGRIDLAKHWLLEACRVGMERGFRIATNFWSPELVGVARRLGRSQCEGFANALLLGGQQIPIHTSTSEVCISSDGAIAVNDVTLPQERWRRGRTGCRQLQRAFSALRVAYPSGIARDELADLLWPDSDGDRAVENLYAAVNDLRHVLGDVPGVRVVSESGCYRLTTAENVRIQ